MKRKIGAALVSASIILVTATTDAKAPTPYFSIPQESFKEIITKKSIIVRDISIRDTFTLDIPTERPKINQVEAKADIEYKVTGKLSGLASWYCKAGVSICHYKYGPSTMSAAAGPKLRAALGPSWRNRWVNVTSSGITVRVKLVDWCQCYGGKTGIEKIIDLYWIAFAQLPNNRVTISW